MQNYPKDFGSLSVGRGKKFRQYYPQYRSKFNITEEIEKSVGTAHRLDNFNLNKVSIKKPPKQDDIEEQFEDLTIETSGWVPMEYRKFLNKSHPLSGTESEEFEIDDTAKIIGQTNSNEESVPSSAYNTALSSSENSFETAEENVSNGEIGELKDVDVKKKVEVITLRAIPVKASSKNSTKNSNKSEVLSFKAKLVTRK